MYLILFKKHINKTKNEEKKRKRAGSHNNFRHAASNYKKIMNYFGV